MLSKAEETGPDEKTGTSKRVVRNIPVLYVRGDLVMAISPLKKK